MCYQNLVLKSLFYGISLRVKSDVIVPSEEFLYLPDFPHFFYGLLYATVLIKFLPYSMKISVKFL